MTGETPIRSMTVSVYLLRWTDNPEILLLQRAKAPARGCWFQVTGRLEVAESAVAAARREVLEETGLGSVQLYAANWVEQWFTPEGNAILLAPVFVAHVARDARVRINAENRAFRWVTFPELRRRFSTTLK